MTKTWGRSTEVNTVTKFVTLSILAFAPLVVLYCNAVNWEYSGSLRDALTQGINIPKFTFSNVLCVLAWLCFQLVLSQFPDVLHLILPGYIGGYRHGQNTYAGNVLLYNINGLQSFLLTAGFLLFTHFYWKFDLTILAKTWPAIFAIMHLLAHVLAMFAYIKAYLFSSHPNDNKYSGCWFYDFYMGIEHNPRIGSFDFKLFFNGRTGIILWPFLNISFAAHQYEKFGYISNSMILVILFQGLYVMDFFWNENCIYELLTSLMITSVGIFLMVISSLPFMYTLQGGYFISNPVNLNSSYMIFTIFIEILGYLMFRGANSQKDRFRSGKWKLNSEDYIECSYETKDGKVHSSKLLLQGWWKWARHANYTGDLLMSLAYSLAVRSWAVIPNLYFVYMCILLITRCYRDEHRCLAKYGHQWKEYCERVKYRLIPGIY